MYRRFKYQLKPNQSQEQLFIQHVNATRFVYNQLLEENIKQYESSKTFMFGFELPAQIKRLRKEHTWLAEVNSQSLQSSASNLTTAFKNRFDKKSKRQTGFPKFKSKRKSRQTFEVPQHFSISNGRIRLPKIGWINYVNHRKLIGEVKRITIIKECGRWYASVLCEIPDLKHDVDETNVVGIDVGIKTFAVCSDGQIFEIAKYKREIHQLKVFQRRLAKSKKGSKNHLKLKEKVAKQYNKIATKKKKSIELFVSTITKTYDVIIMEDLNIQGMKKNRKLSAAIHQNPWFFFKTKIKEKAKQLKEAPRFYPSSKTCSSCGWVKHDLELKDRIFECNSCGTHIDRDLNAAINLKYIVTDATSGSDYNLITNACGDVISPFQGNTSLKQESVHADGQALRIKS